MSFEFLLRVDGPSTYGTEGCRFDSCKVHFVVSLSRNHELTRVTRERRGFARLVLPVAFWEGIGLTRPFGFAVVITCRGSVGGTSSMPKTSAN